MNVGSNFLVPKDGTPLLGLIQDHVVSGVKLTIRGRFFNREDFMYLVLSAFAETRQRFRLPTPAIIKPKLLWSGKQVICELAGTITVNFMDFLIFHFWIRIGKKDISLKHLLFIVQTTFR